MDGFKSTTELRIQTDMDPSNGSSSCLLQRKIEFHPARKPFTGFINGTADFRIETLNPTLDPKRPGSGPCQSAMSCKKPDGSDVLETALDPELSFGITVRKIGAGLENLGNTCFLNSVLQCLTYTEPLAAYLQSGKHRNSCHIAGFCALCAIQKHVSRALQATGRILAPKDLVSNLRCISRNFRNARQEDAHEYMVNLLESMHKCCLPSGVPSESQSAYEKSLVHKIFGGRLRSQVKCLQCSHCSNTFDPFLDLSLELVKADSLHKALTHFTAAELLDGGERQYQCEQCKQKVRALKQLTVNKAPYVLSIHLKRFRAHDSGKIDKKVQFGPTLDMKPFVSGSYEGDLKYTLYGVLVHCGWSIHSGHYYCFVRTSSGMWYSLDDNRVFQVNERTVLEQKAYMLFYVRDRKNTVPRKQMEVVQKENLKAKATVNKTSPIFPQISKEQVPNGLTENKLKGANSYIAMTQKDAAAYPYKENPVKEPAPQQTNGQMMVKHSVVEEDHAVKPTSSVPLLEGTSGAPSALNPHVGVLQASTPCLNNNAKTPHLQGRSTSSGAKSRECGKDKNLSENSKAPVMTSPNCNSPQIVFHQLVTNKASQKNIIITDAVIPNIRLSGDSTDNMSSGILSTNPAGVSGEDTDEAQTLNKSTCENSQVGATSVVSASWNLRNKKAGNNGQIMVLESVDLPTPVGLINGSSEMKVTESTTHRKLKKLQKCKVKKLHVGSKFFMVSLGLCKKKKRKRSKQCTLNTQNPSKELLLDGHNYPSDLGPSTSETLKTDSMDSAHSLRKVDNGITLKNLSKCNGDQLMDATVREFGERIYQNGSVPAAYQQSQKSSASVLGANQHDLREANSSKEGEKGASQNEMMHVLTRGLEETVVAPWDDRGLPPYIEESKSESVSIGYVLDEWDEEYDRGKRKKVRHNKEGLGGPNPFQLLAIKKTQQLKKAKSKHPNSGNLPFRI